MKENLGSTSSVPAAQEGGYHCNGQIRDEEMEKIEYLVERLERKRGGPCAVEGGRTGDMRAVRTRPT